jgi:hypothetical protein
MSVNRTIEQYEAALRRHRGLQAYAARDLGVTQQAVSDRIRRSPRLQQAVAESREIRLDTAEYKLDQAIEAGEAWAICFFLKTQGKSRGYVERQEHSGPDGGPVDVRTVTAILPPLETMEALPDGHRNGTS